MKILVIGGEGTIGKKVVSYLVQSLLFLVDSNSKRELELINEEIRRRSN